MHQLLEALLATDPRGSGIAISSGVSKTGGQTVAAHGMGGLGKTTAAAAIVREMRIRAHFERISWVTVGQTPDIPGLQRVICIQLLGEPPDAELSVDRLRELLAKASVGKHWLIVLDDIWDGSHEHQLNFLEDGSASKVLVTTRFSALLEGGVEVPLGLLPSKEGVDLLLSTARVEWTSNREEIAKEIVAQCGHLPLYIGMIAQMINEYGSDHSWEAEVLAILREDRGSVFNQRGSTAGSNIVGKNLYSIADKATQELFLLLGCCPEDILVPMVAVELVWCTKHGGTRPLPMMTTMSLRTSVFSLVDRSLLIGEASTSPLYST
jgi:hypothetical protein